MIADTGLLRTARFLQTANVQLTVTKRLIMSNNRTGVVFTDARGHSEPQSYQQPIHATHNRYYLLPRPVIQLY